MNKQPINILIVEDEPSHAEAIRRALLAAETPMEIRSAGSLSEFRTAAGDRQPDLVLIDLQLPDGRADEALVSPPEAGPFPMVVMTSHGDEQAAVSAIRGGAMDYVVKSAETFANMSRTVERTLREWRTLQERCEAQRALATREEIFSTIVSQASEAIVLYDVTNARFVEFNRAAHEGLGYTRGEFAKLSAADIQADLSSEDFLRRLGEMDEQGELAFECRHRHCDGRHLDVHVRLRSLRVGERDYISAVWTDVTERKRAEALAARETMRTEFLLGLHQRAPQMTDKELFEEVIEYAVQLTESSIGFFHRVSEDQSTVIRTTWNHGALRNCTAPRDVHSPLSLAGNWADCVRLKQPVVYNDYARSPNQRGLPSGHTPLRRFMSIPVVRDGKALIIFGVGNKALDYTDYDVQQLQVVANELHKILARRVDQDRLRESEERLRQLMETTSDLIWEMDSTGRITYVSPKTTDILGYAPEEIQGRTLLDFMSLVEAKRIHDTFRKLFAEPNPFRSFEHTLLHKSGREIVLEARGVPATGPDGELLGYWGIERDITESRRAEQALSDSELRFRSVVDQAADAFFLVDERFRFVDVNQAACTSLGYSREELLGMTVRDVDTNAGAEGPGQNTWEVLDQGRNVRFQTLHRKKDGGLFPVEVSTSAIEIGGRRLIQGLARDISERMAAEEKLRESIERITALFGATTDSVSLLDTDCTFLAVNQTAARRLGQRQQDLIGRPLSEFLPSPWSDVRKATVKGIVNTRKPTVLEEERYGRLYSISMFPVLDKDGNVSQVASFSRDVTELKRTEEQKTSLEDQLREAQKMEAIGNLAGGIAHDFNNILSPIIGYSEMLLLDLDESDHKRFDLNQILTAAMRAKELVAQILSFSHRGEEPLMRIINVSSVCKEVLKLLRATLPSSIEIQQRFQPVTVLGDATQIHQVIMNLCTNAAHAMEGSGVLDVSVEEVALDESGLGGLKLKPGQYLRLSVEDTGCGMSGENMARIFEPYFTTKGVGKGTGLGLAVVHGIVQRHGGDIRVKSETGKGSLFEVFFPAVKPKVNYEFDLSKDLPRGSERILLVDDEQTLVDLGAKILGQLGYKVTGITSPESALDLFRSEPDAFDLLITDYTMPKLVGSALAEECLRVRPGIPIIICTGFSERLDAEKAAEAGIKGFASKPLNRKVLAELVRNVLDGRPC